MEVCAQSQVYSGVFDLLLQPYDIFEGYAQLLHLALYFSSVFVYLLTQLQPPGGVDPVEMPPNGLDLPVGHLVDLLGFTQQLMELVSNVWTLKLGLGPHVPFLGLFGQKAADLLAVGSCQSVTHSGQHPLGLLERGHLEIFHYSLYLASSRVPQKVPELLHVKAFAFHEAGNDAQQLLFA